MSPKVKKKTLEGLYRSAVLDHCGDDTLRGANTMHITVGPWPRFSIATLVISGENGTGYFFIQRPFVAAPLRGIWDDLTEHLHFRADQRMNGPS